MKATWPATPLGEILTERQEQPTADLLANGEIRIVEKIGFNDGRIQFRSDCQTKTGMILIRPGDLVVSGINATKGAIALYDEENKSPIAATIHYGSYIPDKSRINIQYLWRLLRSNTFRDLLQEYVPGGIKTELKAKRLLPIPVPLPPLEEQRRIVTRVEELAGRIEEARKLRSRLVEEADLLLYIAARKMRRGLLETMAVKPIGDITTVTSGGTPDRSNPLYWNGGTIPWIKTGELFDKPIMDSEERITEAGLNNSSAKIFPIDTVLIALYGQGQTRGRTGLLKIPATTNQACAAILPQPEIFESSYIQHWLRSLYHEMRQQNRDGAQPNWNGNMIKKIKIALPPITEQQRIVAFLRWFAIQT
jgi:type I restriction enzyme, S subunit